MTDLFAPVQVVVDTDKLLESLGWRSAAQGYDGEWYEEGGAYDLRKNLLSEVARQMEPKLIKEMTEVVRDTVKKLAAAKVDMVIDDVVNGNFRQTNGYGEAVGEPITLRSMIVDSVKAELARKVDSQGRSDGYSRGNMPYLDYVAQSAAQQALKGELAEATTSAVEEVKAKVKSVVAEKLGADIARAVTR